MFVTKFDKVFWRSFRILWPITMGWRNKIKLICVFLKALWQQEKYIYNK